MPAHIDVGNVGTACVLLCSGRGDARLPDGSCPGGDVRYLAINAVAIVALA